MKKRVPFIVEEAVCEMAMLDPAFGPARVSAALRRWGVVISPGGVRSVWERHNLETFGKRVKALAVLRGSPFQ